MRFGAIFKINPVVLKFTAFRDNDILNKKTKLKLKKERIMKF